MAEAKPKYLIDPETGNKYRVGGCLISARPSNLPKFVVSQKFENEKIPSVDLRQLMTPIEFQGDLNTW